MTRFYLSWHNSGAVHTRCFSSEAERAQFRRMVDGMKNADIKTWEA